MPELPEVETTCRGIAGHLTGRLCLGATVRNGRLRWPVAPDLSAHLAGQRLREVRRRAKYLLFVFDRGTLIVHLGMSGSLRVLTENFPPEKHDHVDLLFDDGMLLRYRDPRRFGAMLWTESDPLTHPQLKHLGPEPLSSAFAPEHLAAGLAGKKIAIKPAIMDQRIVVGVGNIYASEALFRAGILPHRAAASLAPPEIARLCESIRAVLEESIATGGSTLRDYVDSDGKAGYFTVNSFVYARAGETCRICATPIRSAKLGQRATFWCPHCQH